MAQARGTQFDVVIEEDGASTRATQFDVVVEFGPPEQVRATQFDVVVELGKKAEVRATQFDMLAELVNRIHKACTTVWYNEFNITQYAFGVDIAVSTTRSDISRLCHTEPVYMSVLGAWEVILGGNWTSELDGYLGADMAAGTGRRRVVVRIELPPHHIIWYEWKFATLKRYGIDAPLNEGVEWDARIIFDSVPIRTVEC